jgi:aminoglycoside phosphotransferase (APT) family kinase protein
MQRVAARPERLAERHVPGQGPVTIERLGSGLVNESYRVSRDGRMFSLRLTAPRARALGLDRDWECRVLRSAAAAGLAPAVACCAPRAGVLVSRWAQGIAWTVEQASSPENLARVASLARRVHALSVLAKPRIVSATQWIGFYRRSLERQGGAKSARLRERREAGLDRAALLLVDALREAPAPAATLCHGDLHVQNLVVTAEAPPLILDWEYAHVTDPFWDLAGWTCNCDLTEGCRHLLLELYLGREPTLAEAVRLGRLCWLYDYVCLLWSELYLSSRSRPAPRDARNAGSRDARSAAVRDVVSTRAERLAGRLAERPADRLAERLGEPPGATGRAGQDPAH